MQLFVVYQPVLTEALYTEINAKGWDASDASKAYAKLGLLFDAEKAVAAVRAAADADLYKPCWLVTAENVEGTFALTNGMGDSSKASKMNPKARSGSVGDVVVTTDFSEGWICVGCGWVELSAATLALFDMMDA